MNGHGCEALLRQRAGGPRSHAGRSRAGNDDSIRIAVIGRPNVGKSTLVNRLIGEERVIATDTPGTTRDSIFVPFERDGRKFTLIDTAGVRRTRDAWKMPSSAPASRARCRPSKPRTSW